MRELYIFVFEGWFEGEGGGGGGGAISYDGKKVWSSINNSVLPAASTPFLADRLRLQELYILISFLYVSLFFPCMQDIQNKVHVDYLPGAYTVLCCILCEN